MLPVWLVDDGECWWFVASPTRGKARMYVADFVAMWPDESLSYRILKVREDGSLEGRKPQATVEADDVRELDEDEIAALGWGLCRHCECYTRSHEGLCDSCDEERREWQAALEMADALGAAGRDKNG